MMLIVLRVRCECARSREGQGQGERKASLPLMHGFSFPTLDTHIVLDRAAPWSRSANRSPPGQTQRRCVL